MSSSVSGPHGAPETLADVLASGPLSLAAGLRCANEIAVELRNLHQQGHAYGRLTAASVVFSAAGAHLQPASQPGEQTAIDRDVRDFGAVFHQILTGMAPPATVTAGDVRVRAPGTGLTSLRPAALRVALKCLQPQSRLSMQQVATEIRLLALLVRQYEGRMPHEPPPALAPIVLPPAPPAAPEPAPRVRAWTKANRATPNPPRRVVPEKERSMSDTGNVPVLPLGLDSFGQPAPKPKAELQPAGGHCPKCDSASVYVSRPRSQFERTLDRWNVPICRCHRCYHRYIVFARLKIGKEMPSGGKRKFKTDSGA